MDKHYALGIDDIKGVQLFFYKGNFNFTIKNNYHSTSTKKK